ncbi:peptidoglycan DD-metalloendopeptidase family protein [Fuchsiella alkaliacetigena]|uniref:peptidoglycan DD-metalloendopeptidase family protein n=1 Tax=Fuchsiella alkaliacetigena TaxID=957042 RepID=UPI00200A0BAC|nr:peptidoglycan DD-metalloendopeptidase family protein [Fuchsiella alkaliacetigena]MCK8824780.1 peptidoglycan DD-metalloendopeptidase family protein [Fuchsiella alkaliacetigena]
MSRNSKYVVVLVLIVFLFSFYALASASNLGIRNLREGTEGADVKELQSKLNELGYEVGVDGLFGPQTAAQVKQFQSEYGLSADGIVGSQTLFALKKLTELVEHRVQPGESIYILARRYNTSIAEIKDLNKLDSDIIRAGQKLKIPSPALGGSGGEEVYINVSYQVRVGDSLSVLASRYNSSVNKIMEKNNLTSNNIRAGQEIKIPRRLEPIDVKRTAVTQQRSQFIWPARGRITSGYGYRTHPITNRRQLHTGIDIALPTGTPVKAAASGRVINSTWLSGFGYTVIIEHDEGKETLYAHNSRLVVNAGDEVRQGEVIAYSGSTGQSTGPHLHFEIRVNDNPVDPKKKLPR